MQGYDESSNKREVKENKELRENRQTGTNVQNMPELLTNTIYTPAFLREQIGKLMRVEFLIGTNNLTDRIGILEDVGASYIILRSVESDNLVYADIYSIKFITISANPYMNMNYNQAYNQSYNQMYQGVSQGYNQRYF